MTGKIYVVTGANKGIGYAIVRGLGQKLSGDIIYLAARNISLGEEALKKVKSELDGKLNSDIRFHQLDITDESSCKNFAEYIKKEHGGLDILINNAGFAFNMDATEPCDQQADVTIGINYYGTKLVTSILLPLIRSGGRIVNVCSKAGIMKDLYSDSWTQRFMNDVYTESDIDNFVETYKKLAKEDASGKGHKRKEGGFIESAYRVSKAAEIAYSVYLARILKDRKIIVNGCCPGFVDTDMSSHKGTLTIDQGADTPIYLATDPNVSNGGFYFERKIKEWL
uniref:carbonyl reductase (NADPH) n=1 Tax=Acrobeloides nanus TaxID=290746 RepID=A0A914BVB9_9BILA